MIRHLEKKGTLRLFRRIGVSGSTLRLAVGSASVGETTISIKHDSLRRARQAADAWTRWALEAGYAEIALPKGVPGVVQTLESQAGPGRVRTDTREDVYFETSAVTLPSLKIGERVIVQGVHRSSALKVDYMLGSDLQARRVVEFPEPEWSQFKAKPDLNEKTRQSLMAQAGPAILGHGRRERPFDDVRSASLIFAYERGIHRFLKMGHLKDVGKVVYYEPVLTSNFKRQSAPVLCCIPQFCATLPRELRQEVDRRFGLNLSP